MDTFSFAADESSNTFGDPGFPSCPLQGWDTTPFPTEDPLSPIGMSTAPYIDQEGDTRMDLTTAEMPNHISLTSQINTNQDNVQIWPPSTNNLISRIPLSYEAISTNELQANHLLPHLSEGFPYEYSRSCTMFAKSTNFDEDAGDPVIQSHAPSWSFNIDDLAILQSEDDRVLEGPDWAQGMQTYPNEDFPGQQVYSPLRLGHTITQCANPSPGATNEQNEAIAVQSTPSKRKRNLPMLLPKPSLRPILDISPETANTALPEHGTRSFQHGGPSHAGHTDKPTSRRIQASKRSACMRCRRLRIKVNKANPSEAPDHAHQACSVLA